MNICNGNGECLNQCFCECSDDCICGHKGHCGYCPSNCCIPVKCRNYKYCNTKQPLWVSNCHNGMCMNCAIQMGNHKYTNKIDKCYICYENKNLLLLKCHHEICNDCWYNITKYEEEESEEESIKYKCPFCRNICDWSRK